MKRLLNLSTPLMLVAVLAPTWAQEAETKGTTKEKQPLNTRIREALKLPGSAQDARQAGAEDEEVQEVLERARRTRVPAGEASEVLEETARVTRETGPIDNLGEFVGEQLEQGKRGADLSRAIREEHARRGKGHARGHDKDKARGKAKGHDKGDAAHAAERDGDSDFDRDAPHEKDKDKGKGKAEHAAGDAAAESTHAADERPTREGIEDRKQEAEEKTRERDVRKKKKGGRP